MFVEICGGCWMLEAWLCEIIWLNVSILKHGLHCQVLLGLGAFGL